MQNQLFLLNPANEFNYYEYLPRNFTITTNNNSYKFNIDILKDISSTIRRLLDKNPQNLHYNLKTKDSYNVMSQIEKLLLNDTISIDINNESNNLNSILHELEINYIFYAKEPPEIINNSNTQKFSLIGYKQNTKNMLKINSFSDISSYLAKKYEYTFTISTKSKKYNCNIIAVNSSQILKELLTKDPNLNHYNYDYDDEYNEFQEICNFFNFQKVTLTSDNIDSIKTIAEELQIDIIISYINKFNDEYKKAIQFIDDHQPLIDSIDELFDMLYKIEEITIEVVKKFIIKSNWCKTEENVQELASFILQVIKKDCTLHSYMADLIESLNKEVNKSNKLTIFVPFIVKMLMNSICESTNISSFVFILKRKGIIEIDEINQFLILNLKEMLDPRNIRSSTILFLPEIYEILGHDTHKIMKSFAKYNPDFILSCMQNDFERIKKMRYEGEPDDKITKALRHDDVDTLQSIISFNNIDINKATVPFNLYENYAPNGKTSYINYSAAYGSVKCFKYLLLNHANLDDYLFKFAVFGKNNEIIKIADQHASKLIKTKSNKRFSSIYLSSKNEAIIIAMIKHQNDLFDWIFEQKHQNILNNEDLVKNILEISASNGNIHSIVSLIDKGFNFSNASSELFHTIIEKAAQNGFYSILKFILDLTDRKIEKIDYRSSFYFGNLSIFKLIYERKSFNNIELNEILEYSISKEFDSIIKYFFENIFKEKSDFNQDFCYNLLSKSILSKSNDLFVNLIDRFKKFESNPLFNFDKYYIDLLSEACYLKKVDKAKMIIKLISDVKSIDFTLPFFNATASGSIEICQFLIDLKVQINFELILIQIKQLNNINKEILILIEKNYPDAKASFNNFYLNEAIQSKNKNLIEFISSKNPPIDDALFKAVETNDIEIVNIILNFNSKPSFINQISQEGTALNLAVMSNNVEIVKRLLSIKEINPDLYGESGNTPLITAIEKSRNIEIINAIFNFYSLNNKTSKCQFDMAFKMLINQYYEKNYSKEQYLNILSRFIEIDSFDVCHIDGFSFNLLINSCELNEIEVVEILIKYEKVDVNSYELLQGNTPLMVAINENNLQIAKLLIDCDRVNINQNNYNKETALIFAVQKNFNDIVKIIISDKKFDPIESRLDYAFYLSEGEITETLITSKNLDVNYRVMNKNSIIQNQNQNLNPFVSKTKSKNEIKNSNNFLNFAPESFTLYSTPLISAITSFDSKKVDLIINHESFDPCKSCIKKAIETVIVINNVLIFRKLLKFIDNDVNITNESGENLLMIAIKNGHVDMVNEILNNKNFDSKRSNIYNSFVYSLTRRLLDFDILNKLVDYDKKHDKLIDFNRALPDGKSLFTFFNTINCIDDNIQKIVTFLLENGVDPNTPNNNGVYPLEHAIQISCFTLVKELINSGKIDFSIRINDNLSPTKCTKKTYLHLAVEKNDLDVVSLFIDNKLIDVNVTDSDGRTPLIDACIVENREIIQKLFNVDDLDYLHRDKNGDDALSILQNKNPNQTVSPTENKDEYKNNLLWLIDQNFSQKKYFSRFD